MSKQREALALFDLCRFRTEAFNGVRVSIIVFETQNDTLYLFLFDIAANPELSMLSVCMLLCSFMK